MSMMWVGIGTAVVGAGASIYGANKQSQAIKDANNANATATDKQNNAAWVAWLMSRGIQPTGETTYGQIPTSGNYVATNTKLPVWATMTDTSAPLKAPDLPAVSTATNSSTAGASGTPGGLNASGRSVVKGLADPLGLTDNDASIGSVVRNSLDPLHIFCWAAREAYGEDNPKWLRFREWIIGKAPASVREAYRLNAPRLAERMKDSPALKMQVRAIMDDILAQSSAA